MGFPEVLQTQDVQDAQGVYGANDVPNVQDAQVVRDFPKSAETAGELLVICNWYLRKLEAHFKYPRKLREVFVNFRLRRDIVDGHKRLVS